MGILWKGCAFGLIIGRIWAISASMSDTKPSPKNDRPLNKPKASPQRLALESKALRENLRKRKEQQVARQIEKKGN
jgi:hypothetical protein